MPTISEKFDSLQRTEDERIEKIYLIEDAADDAAALAIVQATAPSIFREHLRGHIDLEPLGNDMWLASVPYAPPECAEPKPPQTGDAITSFNTTGGTEHITLSEETRDSVPHEGTPNFHKLINVTRDGPQGVDIRIPIFTWSETHYLADSSITEEYIGRLFRLTAHTNKQKFRHCEPGEALFLGAAGSLRASQDDWEIRFEFAASPNKKNMEIPTNLEGNFLVVAEKGGWDYLWCRYRKIEEMCGTKKFLIDMPEFAYVERVYDEGRFGDLGIGT